MEAIAGGDLSAEGTLQRLDYRSQRVMGAWRENPVFGWGLSDNGYEYGDGHVGNQCLLAISGIVGFLLLNGFLIYFAYRLMLYITGQAAVFLTGIHCLCLYFFWQGGL